MALRELAFIALIGPLALSTRLGERLGAWLVGGSADVLTDAR